MSIEQIVTKFQNQPYWIRCGAGKLSKRWHCTKEDIYKARELYRNKKKEIKNLPKILIFDIETSPTIAYTWRRFQENISLDQVIQDPIMLTWSAKWLYGDNIMSDKITSDEVRRFDDFRITESLWKLLDEAEVVIAHYGDMFDLPFINARIAIHGLLPIVDTKSIDTKKVASRYFRFPSNKLDALCGYFNIGQKIKTDFSLWKHCLEGDDDSILEMETYNKQDVVILEELYLVLRPFIKGHLNIGLYINSEDMVCHACGSKNVELINKYWYTNTGKYPIYRCECGAQSRSKKSIIEKTVQKNMLVGIPGR